MFRNKNTLTKSFQCAALGFRFACGERNFLIQIGIGIVAVLLAFALPLTFSERTVIVLLTVLVLVVEIINTAFEKTLDKIIKEHDPEIAVVKDLMAAAVLISSVAAFVIGGWIFGRALNIF